MLSAQDILVKLWLKSINVYDVMLCYCKVETLATTSKDTYVNRLESFSREHLLMETTKGSSLIGHAGASFSKPTGLKNRTLVVSSRVAEASVRKASNSFSTLSHVRGKVGASSGI